MLRRSQPPWYDIILNATAAPCAGPPLQQLKHTNGHSHGNSLQDEEPPMTLAMQVYKGPANIPHVAGEFFAAFFLGTNSALLAHMFPGRIFGSEIRPRRFEWVTCTKSAMMEGTHCCSWLMCASPHCSPDYIASCCNEAGMRRQALAGKKPELWLVGMLFPSRV